MKISRTSRLDSEYRRAISDILNGSLKNHCPGLRGLISVTNASVAPDLKTARVFVSVYAANNAVRAETFRLIRENAGFIRHELAQVMRMRTVPSLQFIEDNSMEYGAHMDALFSKMHEKDPVSSHGAGADADNDAEADSDADDGEGTER